MASRKRLKTIFKPLVIAVAVVYFVIDALTLSVLKPLLRKIANLKIFAVIARWIASISPYATLALFLIPLMLLEPVKPLSAYLVASGQFKLGMFVLVVGEILKITIEEPRFHNGQLREELVLGIRRVHVVQQAELSRSPVLAGVAGELGRPTVDLPADQGGVLLLALTSTVGVNPQINFGYDAKNLAVRPLREPKFSTPRRAISVR